MTWDSWKIDINIEPWRLHPVWGGDYLFGGILNFFSESRTQKISKETWGLNVYLAVKINCRNEKLFSIGVAICVPCDVKVSLGKRAQQNPNTIQYPNIHLTKKTRHKKTTSWNSHFSVLNTWFLIGEYFGWNHKCKSVNYERINKTKKIWHDGISRWINYEWLLIINW